MVTQPPRLKVNGVDISSSTEHLEPISPPANAVSAELQEVVGKGTTAIVLTTIVCVTGISSMLAGLVTIALPTMARELHLEAHLLLWYVYSLPPDSSY